MPKYRKKPIVIEAIQFNGKNNDECVSFLESNFDNTLNYPNVATLHGVVHVDNHDWILKGPNGDYWPCKPDIFEQSYEVIEDEG